MENAQIAIIVSTYKRPGELKRLLESLLTGTVQPYAIVVNDDSSDEQTAQVVRSVGRPFEFLVRQPAPTNTAASGWNRALDMAVERFGREVTHFLIVDDDAKVAPDTLELLLEAQARKCVKSSFPAAFDPQDQFYITGQLVDGSFEDAQKRCQTREDLDFEFGHNLPNAWMFQGLCHLIHGDVIHSGIRFDERFWMCGEDLDFSVRVAEKWGSVFVPQASCWHLYGAPLNPKSMKNSNYLKKLSLIQNMTYVGYWRHYGRRIRGRRWDFLRGRGLGKTYVRFLKDYGTNRHTVYDLLWVILFGMFLAQPSNLKGGEILRARRKNFMLEED